MIDPRCPSEPDDASAPTRFIDMAFTAGDAVAVTAAIRARDPAAPFAYIVTPNVDHVVRLQRRRSDLWPAYRGAWMTLCDSRILARLARSTGLPLPVLPGSDLTVRMLEKIVQRDDGVAVVGGGARAIAALADRYGLRRVMHHDPPMGFLDDADALDRAAQFVIDSRARYIFLAVGSPQQEILAHRIARIGGAIGIGLCVGASLDFLTGAQVRAPKAMQWLSMEWLYRLGSDPRRFWRRYLIDGPEVFGIARAWRRDRRAVPAIRLPHFPNTPPTADR